MSFEALRQDTTKELLPCLLSRQHVSFEAPCAAGCISLGVPRAVVPVPASVPSVASCKVQALEMPAVPACFLCPISGQVMEDPVTAADGVTYQREHIMAVIASSRAAPSGEPLSSPDLTCNWELKAAIEAYFALRGVAERHWEDLEVSVQEHMQRIEHNMQQQEQLMQTYRSQLFSLDQRPPKPPAGSCTPCATTTLSSSPRRAALNTPAKDCPFNAGPAPRSARGEWPPPAQGKPPKARSTSRGKLLSFENFRAALTPRLTPRLAQLVRTPRGGQTIPPN